MALVSPGVQVTIIDESQYIPSSTNSVPYILLVTAENKVSGSGVGIAAGTLAANANKTYLISSQRDLTATFGNPFFYTTTAGTPINGYELNEYGLLAAYSALGITNQVFIQRANIDLNALTASLTRPLGAPADGLYWLDTTNSTWGIFQWNISTNAFTYQLPLVITDPAQLVSGQSIPLDSVGNIGDYAITAINALNPYFFKRSSPTIAQLITTPIADTQFASYNNQWVALGTQKWTSAWPTVQGTLIPTDGSFTPGDAFSINGVNYAIVNAGSSGYTLIPNNTLASIVSTINATQSDMIAANINGRIQLFYASTTIVSGYEYVANMVSLPNVISTDPSTILTLLGIAPNVYGAPMYTPSYSYQMPRWRLTDTQNQATGSVWQKTNNVNLGAFTQIKRYSATLGSFILQNTQWYANNVSAIYNMDATGGGTNIAVGATYAQWNPYNTTRPTGNTIFWERYAQGPTIITGASAPGTFTSGNTFTIQATQAGSDVLTSPVTATLAGTTADAFVAAFSAAGVPNTSASVNSAGQIVITHTQGGDIILANTAGTPIVTARINTNCRGVTYKNVNYTNEVVLSNWVTSPTFTYVAQNTAPNTNPANGTYWYYSTATEVDIMIQNNGSWVGYRNCTNSVRGENLSQTNATGPIFSTTAPLTQTNAAASPLVAGDLWINTSDLENYPVISRWTGSGNPVEYSWVQIDNTDSTTSNGILFKDARWAPNGTTNPVTDPIPTIVSLLTSDYLDIDAPNPLLYPQGTLLFNTRRSGFNVKKFALNYFNGTQFPNQNLPAQTSTWVTASGNRLDGSPYMGRQAQRALIVKALKSGIDTSVGAREEQNQFNLLACPQYPELAPNLVALNNERNQTAFVIIDTPLRLSPSDVVKWATNNSGAGLSSADGLLVGDAYSAAFYPSCQTTDLSGSVVVQPPSHEMIRTIIRSDAVAYPWLAPAGTRRGVIDNATTIGYIDAQTSNFNVLGVNQGLRDVLYENRVNPITFIPGVGITNYGNKTTTSITSALDRINVARLICFLRARLESIAKQYLFEPNDQITRNSILNAIDGLMVDLVAKRGIYDYLVVCDLSNNTPARIDRNELWIDIAIEPVKAVEFIYIPVRIKNTGAIAAGQA